MFWLGPEWLQSPIDAWPTWNYDVLTTEEQEPIEEEYCKKQDVVFEAKMLFVLTSEGLQDIKITDGMMASTYSSLTRLIRVIARPGGGTHVLGATGV